jgi:hypothetical protein
MYFEVFGLLVLLFLGDDEGAYVLPFEEVE